MQRRRSSKLHGHSASWGAPKKSKRGAHLKKGAANYAARWTGEAGGESGQCSAPAAQDASVAAGSEASTSLGVAGSVEVVYPMGAPEELGTQHGIGEARGATLSSEQSSVSLQQLMM